jgi:mannose-6-phosphate isomerase-like protein (cupin superfamily)
VSDHAVKNLKSDTEDQAPNFGLSPNLEARFARGVLGLEHSGISYQKLAAGFRVPFGHVHEKQEELYVVVSGGGRAKVGDDVLDLKQWDALRVPPGAWRGIEAGPDGMELLAYGARCGMAADESDVEMEQNWWSD